MISFLDALKFRYRKTLIHQLDPRTKIIYVIAVTILTILTLDILTYTILTVMSLTILFVAKSVNELKRMFKGAIYLILLIFILNFIFSPTYQGLYNALMYTYRFIVLLITFSILFITTKPEELSLTLVKLGFPDDLAISIMMAIRFIPTIARDLQTIIDAQRVRGLELEKGSFITRLRKYIPILIPLIVYEIRRAYQIAEALEVRAYGAVKRRTYIYEIKIKRQDIIFLTITLSIATFLYVKNIIF